MVMNMTRKMSVCERSAERVCGRLSNLLETLLGDTMYSYVLVAL